MITSRFLGGSPSVVQIRVHMAHAGHPLIGDDLYGLEGPWIDRQALHAFSLGLRHPATGEHLEIKGKSRAFRAPESCLLWFLICETDIPMIDNELTCNYLLPPARLHASQTVLSLARNPPFLPNQLRCQRT